MNSGRIVMTEYGPPSVLRWQQQRLPPLEAHEVRIRTIAAAINHSDLEIRGGSWPIRRATPFPYVPGLEVVGEIVERGSATEGIQVGDLGITMMQGLGGVRAERDGGYAEHVTVLASSVARFSHEVDPLELAAIGLAGVTAFGGLAKIGGLEGRTVIVTGAGGGVGSAAVAIASALGAHVHAVASRPEQRAYATSLGAEDVVVARSADELAPRLKPESADGVLDCVAGPLFPALMHALKPHGTLSVVGAVGGSRVELDAYDLLSGVVLTGYSSETLDGTSLRRAIDVITRALHRKQMRAPETTLLPLSEAARGHELLEQHAVSGRILLVPS